jgi:hypothetical protein
LKENLEQKAPLGIRPAIPIPHENMVCYNNDSEPEDYYWQKNN